MTIILILIMVFLVWSALNSWISWQPEEMKNNDKIVFVDFNRK
ncbi:hypothetical protein P343_07780 [Sporolactobacillus laevolacticus DSM 442]|uniref:Uncharacterized protein n=1 Tax=Sporolactobacillus laevolacticus DSM 442 TaxID=1395513 RepID=V6IXZ6_9BACL|nr:hypothetical protein P343_07780 [Sporolactobacillus laevolacticus DSM 442]